LSGTETPARCIASIISTKPRGIKWASPHGEKEKTCETAADLEASRINVFVRQAIAREMEERPNE
jgi:hypothetical protein